MELYVMNDPFGARSILSVGDRRYELFRLQALAKAGLPVERLPYSIKILLENLLRTLDDRVVTAGDVEAAARGGGQVGPRRGDAFFAAPGFLTEVNRGPA